jgi:adenylate kinase
VIASPLNTSAQRREGIDLAVVLLGRPGAGKGTQAQLLADDGWSHLNAGGLVRSEVAADTEWGRDAATLMQRGELLPSADIQALISRELRDCHPPLVIEGFPRRVEEAWTLRALCGPRLLQVVVLIDTPAGVACQRLASRLVCVRCGQVCPASPRPRCPACGGAVARRDDDRLVESVRRRMYLYESLTSPLVRLYEQQGLLEVICGTRSDRQVHDDLLARIGDRVRTASMGGNGA